MPPNSRPKHNVKEKKKPEACSAPLKTKWLEMVMHMRNLNSLQEEVMGSPVALQSWVAGHQYGALMRGGIWEGKRGRSERQRL